MRWTIHRIEDIRRYDVPGHTAYLSALRRPCLGFSRRNKREPVKKPTKTPPARLVTSTKHPNAYQAVEFPQFCGVGRSFSTYRHSPGCRSPPIKISRLPRVTINFIPNRWQCPQIVRMMELALSNHSVLLLSCQKRHSRRDLGCLPFIVLWEDICEKTIKRAEVF